MKVLAVSEEFDDAGLRWRAYGNVEGTGDRMRLSARTGSPPLAYVLSRSFFGDVRVACRAQYQGGITDFSHYGIWVRVTGAFGLLLGRGLEDP